MRGTDVICRSGGVVVQVRGGRAPRAVRVLARYHGPLLASASFADDRLITGGADPHRHNIANPLTRSLARGTGLPALDTSRLRATWLAEAAALIGLPTFLRAAGITCCQRLGDITAALDSGGRGTGGRAARRPGPVTAVSVPLAAIEDIIDASGAAPLIQALLPPAACSRQLTARTLLIGMHLALADARPAHLTRVRQALSSLPAADQERLDVTVTWKTGRTSSPTARPSTPPCSSAKYCPRTRPTARPPRFKHANAGAPPRPTHSHPALNQPAPPRHDCTAEHHHPADPG